MPPLCRGVTVQEWHERAAVDEVRRARNRQLGKGGREVDVEGNGVRYGTGWHARTADDQGNLDRLL